MSDSEKMEKVNPLLAPLTHFVDHPDELAEHTMNSVEWEAVEVLMPKILRGKSKEDVKQLLLAEIDGMSKKRLLAVLAGENLEESSSSEEEEEEEEEEDPQQVEEPVADPGLVEAVPENVPEEMEEGEIEDGEAGEDEPDRSRTPPDPGSPEKVVDTDEEIDRQLEKDLEGFFD